TLKNKIETRLFRFVIDVFCPMPRISRRNINDGLMMLRVVNHVVFEVAGEIGFADTDFTNRKSEAIPNVGRGLHGCARSMCHQHADKLRRDGAITKLNGYVAAGAIGNDALWKGSPFIFLVDVQMHRIIPAPILNLELPGIRHSPLNPNAIDLLARAQVDY